MDTQPLAKRTKQDGANDALRYGCNECGDNFVSQIKYNEHRIRTHNQSFNTLPVEVFEHFLDFVRPNDLVAMSRTCRKYKDLVAKHFEHRRQCGWIEIISENGGAPTFNFIGKEKYETYFRSIIRNIVIRFRYRGPKSEMFQFVKEKCYKNIRSLVLNGSETTINECFFEIIKDQIANLNVLAIGDIIAINFRWERFKHLQVLYNASHSDDRLWLAEKFPNLRTVCLLREEWYQDDLTHFIRHNTNIRTFYCHDMSAIDGVMSTKNHLSNAIFRCNWDYSVPDNLDAIERNYSNIPSFELKMWSFDRPTYRRIGQMEKVHKLHFEWNEMESFLDIEVERLPQIRQLCIRFADMLTERELFFVVEHFPNLSELRIRIDALTIVPPNEVVSYLVTKLPKLEQLFIEDSEECDDTVTNDYDQERNSDRLSMGNVPNVIVHINEEYKSNYDIEKFKINRIIIESDELENIVCPLCVPCQIKYFLNYLDDLRF